MNEAAYTATEALGVVLGVAQQFEARGTSIDYVKHALARENPEICPAIYTKRKYSSNDPALQHLYPGRRFDVYTTVSGNSKEKQRASGSLVTKTALLGCSRLDISPGAFLTLMWQRHLGVGTACRLCRRYTCDTRCQVVHWPSISTY